MNGWLKLHRELLTKPIWLESTPEQKTILITLLMMANHTEKQWEYNNDLYQVKSGQFITSLPNIVKNCGKGVTIQNVRTALKRFEMYGFLTDESTNRNRLITILNWEVYQVESDEPNRQFNRQLTGNQQATNRQLTANKNVKNDKNDKNVKNNTNMPDVPYKEIIDHLNQRTGRRFRVTDTYRKHMNARFKEGFTLEDFKIVIDKKCVEWMGTEWEQYLRPQTLFGTKFDSYLNTEPRKKQSNNKFLDMLERGEFGE